MTEVTSNKRTLEGVVVSNKGDKTIVVEVVSRFMHERYRKTVSSHKKYVAHEEENTCNSGDTVLVSEYRPLSGRKTWMMDAIITRAEQL